MTVPFSTRFKGSRVNPESTGYMVATSVAFWEGLPDDVHPELERALDEVTAEVNRLAAKKSLADKARSWFKAKIKNRSRGTLSSVNRRGMFLSCR